MYYIVAIKGMFLLTYHLARSSDLPAPGAAVARMGGRGPGADT